MNRTAAYLLSAILLGTVIAIAIFGFSIMHESGHMLMGCFGSVPGVNCSMLTPMEHFSAHLRVFQSVSTAVFQASLLAFALLIALLAINIFDIKRNRIPQQHFTTRWRVDFASPQKITFLNWLALHEKRDPSFSYAMNR